MGLPKGRLKAALVAGKIPVTDEAFKTLSLGLRAIGQGYHMEKAIHESGKTDVKLKKDLSRLYTACRTFVDILSADMTGLWQIEAILSDLWRGNQVPRLVEELRALSLRIETALTIAEQNGAQKRRQQNPETWFLLAVHDLFSKMTNNTEPGIAGPLHRFTKHCAELIDAGIAVPERENSFQKRLNAALARRTGRINVAPWLVFPGK